MPKAYETKNKKTEIKLRLTLLSSNLVSGFSLFQNHFAATKL
jgi:hypothetical protein